MHFRERCHKGRDDSRMFDGRRSLCSSPEKHLTGPVGLTPYRSEKDQSSSRSSQRDAEPMCITTAPKKIGTGLTNTPEISIVARFSGHSQETGFGQYGTGKETRAPDGKPPRPQRRPAHRAAQPHQESPQRDRRQRQAGGPTGTPPSRSR